MSEYIRHNYKFIPAKSHAEACREFYERYGYVPAPVFGPVGCGDALESNYVHKGEYACAIGRHAMPHEPVAGNCPFRACTPCNLADQPGCDATCPHWPYDLRQE